MAKFVRLTSFNIKKDVGSTKDVGSSTKNVGSEKNEKKREDVTIDLPSKNTSKEEPKKKKAKVEVRTAKTSRNELDKKLTKKNEEKTQGGKKTTTKKTKTSTTTKSTTKSTTAKQSTTEKSTEKPTTTMKKNDQLPDQPPTFCSLVVTQESNIYLDKDGKKGRYLFNVPDRVLSDEEGNMWNHAAMDIYQQPRNQKEDEGDGTLSPKNKLIFGWKLGIKGMGWLKDYVTFIPNK